jgi:hypothetical protein
VNYDIHSLPNKHEPPAEGTTVVWRKVTRSGHISYEGRPYFVSKTLAGKTLRIVEADGRLVIDTCIPVHKEFQL